MYVQFIEAHANGTSGLTEEEFEAKLADIPTETLAEYARDLRALSLRPYHTPEYAALRQRQHQISITLAIAAED